MTNATLYRDLRNIIVAAEDHAEYMRLRLVLAADRATPEDVEAATDLIAKYSQIVPCDQCAQDECDCLHMPEGFDSPTFLDLPAPCIECGEIGRVTTFGDCLKCYERTCRAEAEQSQVNKLIGTCAVSMLLCLSAGYVIGVMWYAL